jgi:hypothetical protein
MSERRIELGGRYRPTNSEQRSVSLRVGKTILGDTCGG